MSSRTWPTRANVVTDGSTCAGRCWTADASRRNRWRSAWASPGRTLVTSSPSLPWDYREVMRRGAARAHWVLRPSAWLIDDHPFVRYGHGAADAIVPYCGEREQHLCQVAVSVHAVSGRGSSPLHWRLFLPQSWAEDRSRCAKAGVPPEIAHRTKQRITLDLLDELGRWGLAPPLVVADSDYGTNVAFRTGLSARGIRWLLAVTGHTVVLPATGAPVTAWSRRRPSITVDQVAADHRYM
ncbi:transposase [Streptomyces sp. NPDC051677]|uniref:transposase n=1 Tax=Streptomyces sp. NPDC051677 TaxID=3365669 RepID=UPI0037D2E2A6